MKKLFTFGLVLISVIPPIYATHLRAVEIIAKRVNCNAYTYEITVIGYTNSSGVLFGGDNSLLDFGDGVKQSLPEIQSVIIDSFNNVGKAEYRVLHTFPGPGSFLISYTESNRNEGILNMDQSGATVMYTETSILIETSKCNSPPQFLVPPIDRGCMGIAFYHNPGAVDVEGDSLSYELVVPRRSSGTPVTNYLYPVNKRFYDAAGINYNAANENRDGPPTMVIDPVTGTLAWDAPGAVGEYSIAIKVVEWRFNDMDSTWYQGGYVIRDMQIIVENCANQKPAMQIPEDFCVIAGTTVKFNIPLTDPDFDPVLIEAFSDVFTLTESPAERSPVGDIIQSTLPPNDTASFRFEWNTTCSHVRNQPYQIVLKITDRPPSGPRLVQFKTLYIKVIAPAPEYESVTVNPVTKKVTLQLKDYPCENVQGYQIWRRVAEYNYDQPQCENGMPYFLRYKLIGENSSQEKTFTDNDVAVGALYCYRIVALIGSNRISSKISVDTCIIPKPAEAPVITEVSVMRTNVSHGEINVRWTSPFEIDQAQYPPPYQYKVYRASASETSLNFDVVTNEAISDTVFLDKGLNTEEVNYLYQVELYVPSLTSLPVDSSSIASAVLLQSKPRSDQIDLVWDANTPWYNYLHKHPYHQIFRNSSGPDDDFVLIDSVDVNEKGFQYSDRGTYLNERLEEGKTYYYKVLTRGGYGNPRIKEPLENFSQVTGAMLEDLIPPCNPVLAFTQQDCKTLPCKTTSYRNILTWSFADPACIKPGITFELFYAENEDDEFQLLVKSGDYSFTHDHLSSQAKCYKLRATDRAGNKTDFGETVCIDNCPYFELPNVITPFNNDGVNDLLVAFTPEAFDQTRCARHVKSVDLKIYNRWGREIHLVNGITEENNFIFWNGYTREGNQVSSGLYYYEAEVHFDVRNPAEQQRKIKGWLQVLSADQ